MADIKPLHHQHRLRPKSQSYSPYWWTEWRDGSPNFSDKTADLFDIQERDLYGHEAIVEIERLRAALAVQTAQEWQPIDTAPKERQGRVLLVLPSGRVTEGWWGAAKYNRSKKAHDLAWVTSPYSGDVSPLFWMPMPAGPETTPSKGGVTE